MSETADLEDKELADAKREALALVDANKFIDAVVSMGIAMTLRASRAGHSTHTTDILITVGSMRISEGRQAVRDWINGWH